MSRNEIEVAASPARVFGLLGNPFAYASFVVGARRIRRYDPSWPDQGATIHHSLGVGPVAVRDATTVVAVEPERRLDLDAGIGPFGTTRISFELGPAPTGCALAIEEHPCAGVVSTAWNPVLDRLMGLRNLELLRRVKHLVEASGDRQTG